MATKKIKWFQKDGSLLHPETDWGSVKDKENASSTVSGIVNTAAQVFAGRKTFNGGINIPSGATIQLSGSSGTAGYVLTSNGASSAPSWKAPPSSGGNVLDAYPIGTVYIAYTSTSPASRFGGSWTAITGYFPYFNAGTGTGGSNTHTLTLSEMPAHRHGLYAKNSSWSDKTYLDGRTIYWDQHADKQAHISWDAGTHSNIAIMENSTTVIGSGASFSTMPKYQTFYAWRRTA